MPDSVNVITPEGKTISVPVDAVGPLIASDSRYRIESNLQGAMRATQAGAAEHLQGTRRQIEAGARGVLRGATLGLSDVAARAASPADAALGRDLRHEYGTTSSLSEIAGAILTAVPSGGASLEMAGARTAGKAAVERIVAREAEQAALGVAERSIASQAAALTPSGWLAGKAAQIAGRGAAGGTAKRVGYQALGGAVEGGIQNVGSYVSDVALGDRDLSAEGLAGSFRDGALFGGAGGGLVGVTESGLQRARGLFPESQITREAAEASQREAHAALTSMASDASDLEKRATAAIGDIKAARSADPEVLASAARIRAEREAKLAAQRARAEAQAAQAQANARGAAARADAAEARAARAKEESAPRRKAAGTPSDGVPTTIGDAPYAPVADVAPPLAPTDAAAVGASDLEQALAATNARLKGGKAWADVQAEGKAARAVAEAAPDAVDDLERAVIAHDPTAAKLAQLRDEVRIGRQGVADWLDAVGKRADAKVKRQIEAGLLSRDDDVIRSVDGGEGLLGAKTGAMGRVTNRERAVRSRLRNQYTDEELIAKAENNPTFLDLADAAPGSDGFRMTARDALVDRIISGKSAPDALHVEQLVSRIDEATGEILPGLRREVRPATREDIIGAIERNRRNPDYDSFVPDEIMEALRGRLDAPDDLAKAIPAIAKLEHAEASLAEHLGERATPGSAARVPSFRAAEAAHAETRAMADAQRMAAIEDVAMPQIADAASRAKAADAVAAGLPTEKLPNPADLVALPDAVALPGTLPTGAREGASKLADVAAAIEVMSSIGIPGLPSAHDIPLVGPVLGLYLKARAGMSVWKKLGGKLPASIEGTVAAKSAATRDRMAKAVRSMIDGAATATTRQSVRAGSVAEVLGRSVFSEQKRKPKERETLAEMWARHRAELAAAQRPGAIERMVRDRVPTGDPRLAASLTAVARRKFAWLDQKMPRPPGGARDPDAPPWRPTEAQAEQWARVVDAADDPAGVLERAAAGTVSLDEIETVRAVYPRLYQETQSRLLEAIADGKSIPYQRRVQLGVLFEVPLTPAQDPEFVASMQAGYDAELPEQPTPRTSANVDLSSAAMLQEMSP